MVKKRRDRGGSQSVGSKCGELGSEAAPTEKNLARVTEGASPEGGSAPATETEAVVPLCVNEDRPAAAAVTQAADVKDVEAAQAIADVMPKGMEAMAVEPPGAERLSVEAPADIDTEALFTTQEPPGAERDSFEARADDDTEALFTTHKSLRDIVDMQSAAVSTEVASEPPSTTAEPETETESQRSAARLKTDETMQYGLHGMQCCTVVEEPRSSCSIDEGAKPEDGARLIAADVSARAETQGTAAAVATKTAEALAKLDRLANNFAVRADAVKDAASKTAEELEVGSIRAVASAACHSSRSLPAKLMHSSSSSCASNGIATESTRLSSADELLRQETLARAKAILMKTKRLSRDQQVTKSETRSSSSSAPPSGSLELNLLKTDELRHRPHSSGSQSSMMSPSPTSPQEARTPVGTSGSGAIRSSGREMDCTVEVQSDNLAELVFEQIEQHKQRASDAPRSSSGTGMAQLQLPEREERLESLQGDGQLVDSDEEDEDEATKKSAAAAHALVEMGFKVGEAHTAAKQSQSLTEAANTLLEKTSPPRTLSSIWQNCVNWFGDGSPSHRPGKYRIVRSQGSQDGASPTEGQNVNITEIFVNAEIGLVRGKMADGRWISIASSTSGDVWAMPVPLVQQLLELGFTDRQAREAEKRCSTVEGAVEFLTGGAA